MREKKVKLTGGAKATSIIELTPISGGWQRPRVLRRKIDKKGKFLHYVCLYNSRISSPESWKYFNIQNNLSILCVFYLLLF
jgi:hypothetical protein